MPKYPDEVSLITKFETRSNIDREFADWQANLNHYVSNFDGFISFEILSPASIDKPEWVVIQRFSNQKSLQNWRDSSQHKQLLMELNEYLKPGQPIAINEIESAAKDQANVAEVFVTQVQPEKINAFREWAAKIHKVEAQFPGFKGMYLQSPIERNGTTWITFLQFDTTENLDKWLESPERRAVLNEGKPLVKSLESHRVISPYSGWFANTSAVNEVPPVWKQTMMVLLVLFPIIMLELKFLSPLTAPLNPSLATFIGNAISVTLVSWPTLPIAIYFMNWWLTPDKKKDRVKTAIIGTLVMAAVYLVEIIVLWKLL